MQGQLSIWGFDDDGQWKKIINCDSDFVPEILGEQMSFDDYDFECLTAE